jgi:hypothetical protein
MNTENLAARYASPAIKGLLAIAGSLNPIIAVPSAVTVVGIELMEIVARERQERQLKTFFDKLNEGEITLDKETIANKEFLHRYFITLRTVLKTNRDEKIKVLADFLINRGSRDLDGSHTDIYEEYLGIIDELSYRELLILRTLEEFEKRLIGSGDGNIEDGRITKMSKYWAEFQNTVSELTEGSTLVPALMKRLERSGLFQVADIWGDDDKDNRGFLTDLYYDLKNDLTNISPLPSTAEN